MIENCQFKDGCELGQKEPWHCNITCSTQRAMNSHFANSNLDKRYQNFEYAVLAADKDTKSFLTLRKIEESIFDFAFGGHNLILFSQNTGNGKTSWAIRLMQRYIHDILEQKIPQKYCAVFVTMFEFLDRQRDNMDGWDEDFNKLKHRLLSAQLVVWDDLATISMSEWGAASFLNVLDTRVSRGLSNIFTTNLNPESKEFLARVGPRLYSRITKSSCIIEFVDPDKRKAGEMKFGSSADNL